MAVVEFGSVLAGARPFHFNDNVNDVFRGEVLCTSGGILSAFIKDLPLRQLVNELIASTIASHLDLPVPTPILAVAKNETFNATNVPYGGDAHLVFASSAADARPVLQILSDAGRANEVYEILANWERLGELYGFDSWLANVDRHRGNLLMGGEGDLWMIDHGHCLTGPTWNARDLKVDSEFRNRLSEWLTPSLSGSRRVRAVEQVMHLKSSAESTDVEELLSQNRIDALLKDEFNNVVRFLKARVEYIEPLSRKALGVLV
ncbi:HipA family kinase [Qipengyuania sp.]|uniref:HipA family kinase n=1 Tax=Qipengyuania sp. TaxID=2004515 RepID=UPI003AF73CE3